MSSSNINDPSAIQALLDQLRSSEAWQKAVNANTVGGTFVPTASTAPVQQEVNTTTDGIASTSTTPDAPLASTQGPEPSSSPQGHSTPNSQSVASLLSQLQASNAFAAVAGTSRPPAPRQPSYAPPPAGRPEFPGPDDMRPSRTSRTSGEVPGAAAAPAPTPTARQPQSQGQGQDVRTCTFQQALPHLARLAGDDGVLQALAAVRVSVAHWGLGLGLERAGDSLTVWRARGCIDAVSGYGQMRAEQTALERQLWKERREIQRRHEDRVKAARTQADIIGAGLTQYEADVRPAYFLVALTDSFRSELQKFDRSRTLPAWDGLLTKQQAALEALGVPAMFPTTQKADREVRDARARAFHPSFLPWSRADGLRLPLAFFQRQQEIMQVLGRIVQNEGGHPTPSPVVDGQQRDPV
ncbi:hypothetical protein C8Q79DRAFT_1012266 [Trametes meyenii]|nr:hypothetical protein C8Q79DRAFT_1012266 [Trametes meyenii]